MLHVAILCYVVLYCATYNYAVSDHTIIMVLKYFTVHSTKTLHTCLFVLHYILACLGVLYDTFEFRAVHPILFHFWSTLYCGYCVLQYYIMLTELITLKSITLLSATLTTFLCYATLWCSTVQSRLAQYSTAQYYVTLLRTHVYYFITY